VKSEKEERREFLKRAGKLAATAPAVAMLLSSSAMPARANGRYGGNGGEHRGNNGGGQKRGHTRGRGHDGNHGGHGGHGGH
jgi:hypothetical protein